MNTTKKTPKTDLPMHLSSKAVATWLFALLFVTACDDNTADLGINAESDEISNSITTYDVTTRSHKMDAVVANSTISYLGSITDPETGSDITADFAAQFYTFEDYKFPAKELMLGEVDGMPTRGIIQCDSCEVRLYFDDFYGDDNNPMKLEVYELSNDKLLEETETYYTDIDLTQFLPEDAKPIASRMFTPKDYNVDDTNLSGTKYNSNIRIMLPQSLGQRIMEKYYQNPDNFSDSYHFIRNVFPGLYFKITGGQGTMLAVYVGTLNIFYRYADEDETKSTPNNGLTRLAATPEVIQSTHFTNENVDQLVEDATCTYLKTPAGICTEMTLPIDEIFAGQHANDSISLATITLTRYNKPQDKYQLGTPGTLLMVRKQDMQTFFTEHRVTDNRTCYTTTFASNYNTYTFANICRLISYCKYEKDDALKRINEERRQEGLEEMTEAEWMEEHPDWNRVVLIPVITSTNTSGAQVSVTHDLSLNSIRLVGGDTKIKMQVVYSKFYQE